VVATGVVTTGLRFPLHHRRGLAAGSGRQEVQILQQDAVDVSEGVIALPVIRIEVL
jgi:hypothetical protein